MDDITSSVGGTNEQPGGSQRKPYIKHLRWYIAPAELDYIKCGQVEGLKEVVVLSQQRRVSDKLLEVMKQRRLNVIHEKIPCVLGVTFYV
jgi:hypothetical protein